VTPPVGVVGASARAAAMSLVRAGYAPWAVDLFTDRDLLRIAECVRCPLDRYPDALPELCDRFPPGPILYTGGLENHPAVVGELARRRSLWGNGPESLAAVRDPFAVAATLATAGFATPGLLPRSQSVPPDGRFVSKPLQSSGGLGVRFARSGEAATPERYQQEWIDGPPMSAVFVGSADTTTLLDITDQLIGEPWLHAGAFAYCGNVGPVPVTAGLRDLVAGVGRTLGRVGRLRGPWGLDFVLRDGLPYPLEINPRYTAGVEVLELARSDKSTSNAIGKAVYYAPHRLTFPRAGPWDADLADTFDPWRMPGFADIPAAGEVIDAGSPVLTFFAAGSTAAACRATLRERAADLDGLFVEESTR